MRMLMMAELRASYVVGKGFPAAGPSLRMLIAELRASYVGGLELSSVLRRYVGAFKPPGPVCAY